MKNFKNKKPKKCLLEQITMFLLVLFLMVEYIPYPLVYAEDDTKNLIEYINEDLISDDINEEDIFFERPHDFTQVAELQNLDDLLVEFVQEDGLKENEYVETIKTVHYNAITKEHYIKMQSYLTGASRIEKRIPTDVVLVLDQSGSMDYCFDCADDNADSVKFSSNYSKLMKGDLNAEYWCYNQDNTSRIQVYFCDNKDTCQYVDANGNKKTHTAGWRTINHTSETTSLGYAYVPGPEDSPVIRSKIFYSDESCTDEYRYYDVINEKGEPCFGKFSTKGTYYYGSAITSRLYYCENCKAWFTKKTCSSSNHTLSYLRYPSYASGYSYYRAYAFYAATPNHPVYAKDIDKSKSYKINQKGRLLGEDCIVVNYCDECQAWHIENQHDSTHYTPKSSSSSSGTTFYGECTINRGAALKEALDNFLLAIYEDSAGKDKTLGTNDDVPNRVSVVGFSANDKTANGIISYATESDETASLMNYATLYGADDVAANPNGGTPNLELFANSMHDVSTERGQKIINDAVSNLKQTGNTETFKGMRMAKDVLVANPVEQNDNRIRVVILFTDGEPVSQLEPGEDKYNTGTSYRFCDAALGYAKEIKDTNCAIYTIGIFSGSNSANLLTDVGSANRNNANKFMHLISNNFLNAVDSDITYSESDINPDLRQGESYYLSASSTDALNDIFSSIAANITGNAAFIQNLGSPSMVQDIISSEFKLRYDLDTDKIRVYSEAYNGIIDGVASWINDGDNTTTANVSIKIDDKQTLQVSGFNFTEHYVSTDIDSNGNETHRGRKLVIEIPIQRATDNNGGLMQETNVANQTAIFDQDGGCLENFKSPYLDIPAIVTIKNLTVGIDDDLTKLFDFLIEYENVIDYAVDLECEDKYYLKISDTELIEDAFQLKHNESKKFDTIMLDSQIKISEINIPKYCDVYYFITYPDGTSTENIKVTDEIITLDVVPGMVVTFTNVFYTNATIININTKNEFLEGSILQVIDENGNVVYKFTTTNKEHIVELNHGHYVLHQSHIPSGYLGTEDVEFTVTSNNEENIVIIINSPLPTMVLTGGNGYVNSIAIFVLFAILSFYAVYKGRKIESITPTDMLTRQQSEGACVS